MAARALGRAQVTLYKYVFPPDLPHPTLAIVGLVQPLGSLMPIAEMQCRWISRVLSGKVGEARCGAPLAATAAHPSASASSPPQSYPLRARLPS